MSDEFIDVIDRVRGNWTVLPPLKLRGAGTPLVESLRSFVVRILIATGMGSSHLARELGLRISKRLTCIGGFIGTKEYDLLERAVDDLQILTGANNLRSGTFWALSRIISTDGQKNHEHSFRRWCPICYREWGADSYEPLAWTVDLLRTCPVHGCMLNNACWSCKSPQSPYLSARRRSLCDSCGADLSASITWIKLHPFLQWVERQALDMIAFCAEPRAEPVPHAILSEFLKGLRRSSHLRRGDTLTKSIDRILMDAKLGRRKVSLRSLVNLCAVQGVSLGEFLAAPRETSGPLLFGCWGGLNYMPIPTARQAQKIYVASRCLKDFLHARPAYYPPICHFLKRFQVQLLAVRDVAEDAYDIYIAAHSVHGDAATQRAFRAAYLCAVRVLSSGNPGQLLGSEVAAAEVVERTEVSLAIARHAVKSAALVKKTQSEGAIGRYEREMPLDKALDWFVENRRCSWNGVV